MNILFAALIIFLLILLFIVNESEKAERDSYEEYLRLLEKLDGKKDKKGLSKEIENTYRKYITIKIGLINKKNFITKQLYLREINDLWFWYLSDLEYKENFDVGAFSLGEEDEIRRLLQTNKDNHQKRLKEFDEWLSRRK